jgi:hypothetical protein
MFSPLAVRAAKFPMEPNMVRVVITGFRRQEAILPMPIVGGFGIVICTTHMREKQKCGGIKVAPFC